MSPKKDEKRGQKDLPTIQVKVEPQDVPACCTSPTLLYLDQHLWLRQKLDLDKGCG